MKGQWMKRFGDTEGQEAVVEDTTTETTWSQLTEEQQQYLTDTLGAKDTESMINNYSLEYILSLIPDEVEEDKVANWDNPDFLTEDQKEYLLNLNQEEGYATEDNFIKINNQLFSFF